LENAPGINANLAISGPYACPIAHQPAISYRFARFVDRRQGMAGREGNKRDSMVVKERIIQRYEGANLFALRYHERRFKFTLVGNLKKSYFSSECGGGTLDSFSVCRIRRCAWPPHKSNGDLLGHQLRGQFQTLLDKLAPKEADASDIAAGSVEACNIAKFDGIASRVEYNGNCCRGSLG